MKRVVSVLLTLALITGMLSVPLPAAAESVIKKTMREFEQKNLSFDKEEGESYRCKVENNGKGFIKVDSANYEGYYYLLVKSQKPTTAKKKPRVILINQKDNSVVKTYEFTVNAAKKVTLKTVKIQKGTSKVVKINNPYIRSYKLKYNRNKIKVKEYPSVEDSYTVTGLKKGTHTIKATIDGKVLCTVKIKVGNYKASVKKKAKKQTLKYNRHIKSYELYEGGLIDIKDLIKNIHPNAVYTVKIKKKKIVAAKTIGKSGNTPKRVGLYSKKPGKTSVDIYEKRGKAKKKKIGTIKVTVKQISDAAVVSSNRIFDNDGLFYENRISVGSSYNLKSAVVSRYVNWRGSGSHFNAGEYSFKIVSAHPDIISVDKNGVCHCIAPDPRGINRVNYTITFKDGSTFSGGGSFDVEQPDD